MKKIVIDAIDQSYEVFIGDVISVVKEFVCTDKEILLITDETVKELHVAALQNEIDIKYLFVLGKRPEDHKNLAIYEKCVEYAMSNHLDRNILVIAFGGGAVTDFAGFFASTYKRGVSVIHIPTTLLSHDSAIGGKTALNAGKTKNVIGTIYQPKAVIYHLPFLNTLPLPEILSGFGEIIKHDLLSEGYLIQEVLDTKQLLQDFLLDPDKLTEIIYRSILVKKMYIEMDIYDKLGKRQYLNFGHTLGHALEILYRMSHGEAISFGMCFAIFLENQQFALHLYKKLKAWGYFTGKIVFNIDEITEVMKNDKKNDHDLFKFISLKDIGEPFVIYLTTNEFKDKFAQFLRLGR